MGGLQPGRFYLIAGAPEAGASPPSLLCRPYHTALDLHLSVLYAAHSLTREDVAMQSGAPQEDGPKRAGLW
ncbi:hypothetical protein ABH930_007003 [Kitasatospora sp. GAS204A]|nr:hypothetical protein [Kitasatospora sp. GAS204B]